MHLDPLDRCVYVCIFKEQIKTYYAVEDHYELMEIVIICHELVLLLCKTTFTCERGVGGGAVAGML